MQQILQFNTHIYGLVAEVLDVLGAHVERRLAGHDECWRQSIDKFKLHRFPVHENKS